MARRLVAEMDSHRAGNFALCVGVLARAFWSLLYFDETLSSQ